MVLKVAVKITIISKYEINHFLLFHLFVIQET